MNNWNIPGWLENKIRNRDKKCVYCNKKFGNNFRDKAEWEHIDNDEKNISEENIALCCGSCNRSKGAKMPAEWFKSDYCEAHDINKKNVSEVVKKHSLAQNL